MDNLNKNKLLFSRAGFGISLTDYQQPRPVLELATSLLTPTKPEPITIITEAQWMAYNPKALKDLPPEQKKEMAKDFRKHVLDINGEWMKIMVTTKSPLVEKMALFWHGHFATRIGNPWFDQKLVNILRENALNDFGTLLKAVSKSAAMLQFLNNKQNKKEHPNENFAREVMELFTLSRGNYTEFDVKEAARAFTGWSYDEYGDFVFRERFHDTGEKTFLGKRGRFDGDDILNLLLQQQTTANFITEKIYRYFVSDEATDNKTVSRLAQSFYEEDYDIKKLLHSIFTADWFYKQQVTGAKIKSPIELIVGYQRLLPITFNDPKILIRMQRVLGQQLFEPPNVAGWPGGKSWIDSTTIVTRMRLPEGLLASKELDLTPKETDPEMGTMEHMGTQYYYRKGNNTKTSVDWGAYLTYWKTISHNELPGQLADYLLAVPVSTDQLGQINAFADNSSAENYIKSLTILLMGLPEYQLG